MQGRSHGIEVIMRRIESPHRAVLQSPGRLRSFGSPARTSMITPSRLRKAPKIGLSDEELQGLREAFSLFDVDGSGVIEPKELKAELEAMGFANKSPTVFWFISQLAGEYTSLTIDQCLTAMESRLAYTRQTREVSDKVFETIDDEKKGAVGLEKMKKVAKEVGQTLTDEEISEIVKKAASNGSEVTKDDFFTLLTRKPPS